MKILVVGLGLIGGSLAKALSQYTDHEIWGMDQDSASVTAALEEGTEGELLIDIAKVKKELAIPSAFAAYKELIYV